MKKFKDAYEDLDKARSLLGKKDAALKQLDAIKESLKQIETTLYTNTFLLSS